MSPKWRKLAEPIILSPILRRGGLGYSHSAWCLCRYAGCVCVLSVVVFIYWRRVRSAHRVDYLLLFLCCRLYELIAEICPGCPVGKRERETKRKWEQYEHNVYLGHIFVHPKSAQTMHRLITLYYLAIISNQLIATLSKAFVAIDPQCVYAPWKSKQFGYLGRVR